MIKDGLSVLPTRPIRYIVPAIVIVVLSLYYWEQYNKCSEIKNFRNAMIRAIDSRSESDKFRLAEFTQFVWDKVRIVTNIQPGERNVECPFGWNWEKGERESLMSAGLLTVLMFGQGESIVGYVELRSDEIMFRGVESSLNPQAAVFTITKNVGDKGVTLSLNNQ